MKKIIKNVQTTTITKRKTETISKTNKINEISTIVYIRL